MFKILAALLQSPLFISKTGLSWNKHGQDFSKLAPEAGNCGIGVISSGRNGASSKVLVQAFRVLDEYASRGTIGCGLHVSKPPFHKLLKADQRGDQVLSKALGINPDGYTVPQDPTHYATSLIFLPQNEIAKQESLRLFNDILGRHGFALKLVRKQSEVINLNLLSHQPGRPYITQLFIERIDGTPIREQDLATIRLQFHQENPFNAYLPTLSVHSMNFTAVATTQTFRKGLYKDMFVSLQSELHADPRFEISYALAHVRFPTCGAGGSGCDADKTVSALWVNAQPAEQTIHNGTFTNTATLIKILQQVGIQYKGESDSQLVNLVIQSLVDQGMSVEDALLMAMQPFGTSTHDKLDSLTPLQKWHILFGVQFHGPASLARYATTPEGNPYVVFTRGPLGLRPFKLERTQADMVSITSQANPLAGPDGLSSPTSQPPAGSVWILDLRTNEVREYTPENAEALNGALATDFEKFCTTFEYDTQDDAPILSLSQAERVFEKLPGHPKYKDMQRELLDYYASVGAYKTGSMGRTFPPAAETHNSWFNTYFTHACAQILLPAVDDKRELNPDALACVLGRKPTLLDIAQRRVLPGVILEKGPVLFAPELEAIKKSLQTKEFSTTFTSDTLPHADTFEAKIEALKVEILEYLTQHPKTDVIILSDFKLSEGDYHIPMAEIGGILNKFLSEVYSSGALNGNRIPSLVAKTSEIFEYSDVGVLGAVGFTAVCPWLAESLIRHKHTEDVSTSLENYRTVIKKGLLSIMSKMPCLNWTDFVGAYITTPEGFDEASYRTLGFRGSIEFPGRISLRDIHTQMVTPVSSQAVVAPSTYDHAPVLAQIHAALRNRDEQAFAKALEALHRVQSGTMQGEITVKPVAPTRGIVVGAGYSGLEAVMNLIEQGYTDIWVIERDIFGGGRMEQDIAPWHADTKSILEQLRKRLGSKLNGVTIKFTSNVSLVTQDKSGTVSGDLRIQDLAAKADCVLVAIGADIPNLGDFPGNGQIHPSSVLSKTLNHASSTGADLMAQLPQGAHAAIIGAGNVALDDLEALLCTHKLLDSPQAPVSPDFLRHRQDKVTAVDVLIRRDAYTTSFTAEQLEKTLSRLRQSGVAILVENVDLDMACPYPSEGLNPKDADLVENHRQIVALLKKYSAMSHQECSKHVTFKFNVTPTDLNYEGEPQNSQQRITYRPTLLDWASFKLGSSISRGPKVTTESERMEPTPYHVVFAAMGYKRVTIPGLDYLPHGKTSIENVSTAGWLSENGKGTAAASKGTVTNALRLARNLPRNLAAPSTLHDVFEQLLPVQKQVSLDAFALSVLSILKSGADCPEWVRNIEQLPRECVKLMTGIISTVHADVFGYFDKSVLFPAQEAPALDAFIDATLSQYFPTTSIPKSYLKHLLVGSGISEHVEFWIRLIVTSFEQAQLDYTHTKNPRMGEKGIELNLVAPAQHEGKRTLKLTVGSETHTITIPATARPTQNLRDFIGGLNLESVSLDGTCSSGGVCGLCTVKITAGEISIQENQISSGTLQAVSSKTSGLSFGGRPGDVLLACNIPLSAIPDGAAFTTTLSEDLF